MANETLKSFLEANVGFKQMWGSKNTEDTLMLTTGSKKKVWWKCEKFNVEFQAPVVAKIKNPNLCSVCNGPTVFPGVNDLQTLHPEIAAEWDTAKNGVAPDAVKHSSGRKAWFTCPRGHEYQTLLSNRTILGTGCSKCSSIEAFIGDLKDEMSSMAADPTFLGLSRKSKESIGWKCPEGHEWTGTPENFKGCPYCNGTRVTYTTASGVTVRTAVPSNGASVADNPAMLGLFAAGNSVSPESVAVCSAADVGWTCPAGHNWVAKPYSVKKSVESGFTGCPHCTQNTSKGEKELQDLVRQIVPIDESVLVNDRSASTPYELDVYVPSRKVAVEFNGLYWHSERFKSPGYHRDKYELCRQAGVQLVTVWEDDWKFRQDVVVRMLQHKLGLSAPDKVHARKTQIVEITAEEARDFCGKNHIQGFTQGSLYVALREQASGELVAVSVWRRNKELLYLDRYCTSKHVVGGMGKLLKYVKAWAAQQNLAQIVTFSDHTVSNGGLYKTLGFRLDKELSPDYSYIVNGQRVHKFNYRKDRFKKDPALRFKEGLSESELADLNGLQRVWDSGKDRWVMLVS